MDKQEECVYEGDCLCHEGTTFVTGPAAPAALCAQCSCYLPRGSITASSEFAAIRKAAADKVRATEPETGHTALINGRITVVESHPTKVVERDENYQTRQRVVDSDSCLRCAIKRWAEALADSIEFGSE